MGEIKYVSQKMDVSMGNEWFEVTYKNHFWMQWRTNVIKRYLKLFPVGDNQILEIGCGNGLNIEIFEEQLGMKISGCDLNLSALHQIRDVSGVIYLYNIFDLSNQLVDRFEMIWLFDVVEHIEDDLAFVQAALAHLKVNGYLLINVPAFNGLYGKYDKTMGHYRRYSKKQMSTLLDFEGIQIVDMHYWGLFLMPVVLIRSIVLYFTRESNRVKRGFSLPSKFINRLFLMLMAIELKFFKRPIVGSSLFVVVKKISS